MRAKRVRCRKSRPLVARIPRSCSTLAVKCFECSQNAHDPVVDVRGRPGVLLWHGLGHSCRGGMGRRCTFLRRAKTPENHDDLMAVADCKQLKVVTMLKRGSARLTSASMQIGRNLVDKLAPRAALTFRGCTAARPAQRPKLGGETECCACARACARAFHGVQRGTGLEAGRDSGKVEVAQRLLGCVSGFRSSCAQSARSSPSSPIRPLSRHCPSPKFYDDPAKRRGWPVNSGRYMSPAAWHEPSTAPPDTPRTLYISRAEATLFCSPTHRVDTSSSSSQARASLSDPYVQRSNTSVVSPSDPGAPKGGQG
ncbi:hypothetical protein L1887_48085 [Cichorium endivia]|nr:hypothetical protein L1887_48085 [Cichorium endivia]